MILPIIDYRRGINMKILVIFYVILSQSYAGSEEIPCKKGLPPAPVFEKLENQVDLVTCQIPISAADQYTTQGCQKIASCYRTQGTNFEQNRYQILNSLAQRHLQASILFNLGSLQSYETLKLSIENDYPENLKDFKLCPAPFNVQAVEGKCNIELFHSVFSTKKYDAFSKSNVEYAKTGSALLPQLKQYLSTTPKGKLTAELALEFFLKDDFDDFRWGDYESLSTQ
jgi:hypothetical protein